MLSWSFSELHQLVTFSEELQCHSIVEARYDVQDILKCHVSGQITFNGTRGHLKLVIEITAKLRASNTGEAISFADKLSVEEFFDFTEVDIVDSSKQRITILDYVLAHVDMGIPAYVTDPKSPLATNEGSHWQLMDERTYQSQREQNKSEAKFAQLSSLLTKE